MDSAPVSSVLGSGGTTSESQDENTISGWPSFHGVNDLNAFFFVVGLGDEKKQALPSRTFSAHHRGWHTIHFGLF